MSYSPEPITNKNKTEVKLDMSHQATNLTLKMQQIWIHHNLLKKMIQVTQKTKVAKLDTDKLKTAPANLNKLIDLVKNDAVKGFV